MHTIERSTTVILDLGSQTNISGGLSLSMSPKVCVSFLICFKKNAMGEKGSYRPLAKIYLYLLYFCHRSLLLPGWEGVVSVTRVRERLTARKELIFDCLLSDSSTRLHGHVTSTVMQGFAFGRVLGLG